MSPPYAGARNLFKAFCCTIVSQEEGRPHELQPQVEDGDERDAEQEELFVDVREQGREERDADQADVHGLGAAAAKTL